MGIMDMMKETADNMAEYKAEYRECDDDELRRMWKNSGLSFTRRAALTAVMKERGLK